MIYQINHSTFTNILMMNVKDTTYNCLFFANSVASSSFISGGARYVKESSDTYDIKYSETDMFRTNVVFEVDGGYNFTLYYKNNEAKALY